jgi:hypothetical protein
VPKSLSSRIAERLAHQKPSLGAQNRATFLALRAEIKQALDDGWPVKTIWETLRQENKLTFSYPAFLGYVKRLILPQPDQQAAPPRQPASVAPPPPSTPRTPTPTEKKTDKPVGPGFRFDPVPKKEDLL